MLATVTIMGCHTWFFRPIKEIRSLSLYYDGDKYSTFIGGSEIVLTDIITGTGESIYRRVKKIRILGY